MIEYPKTRIVSIKSAMEWIKAEWAEQFFHDGIWYIAGNECHVQATPRQQDFLNKAQKKLDAIAP